MTAKVDTAAAERILKRAVEKALARLATAADPGDVFAANYCTLLDAVRVADMLTEERAA